MTERIRDTLRQMDVIELIKLAQEHPDLSGDSDVQFWVKVVTDGISMKMKGNERSTVPPGAAHYVERFRECIRLRLDGIVVSKKGE